MKTILFVHQSADLYGSDKVLLSLLNGLDKQQFRPIVFLPCEGPLLVELRKLDIPVYVVPLSVVGRATLSFSAIIRLPFNLLRSMRAMTQTLAGIDVDIVHSNTLAVISGASWAKLKGIPHVWHVHEIIVHPRLVRNFFPFLIRILADKVVCNSCATQKNLLDSQPKLARKSVVIGNGIERLGSADRQSAALLRQKLGIDSRKVLVVLVGRINRLKGQGLLVEAANSLWEKGEKNIQYLLIGSPPHGQEQFRENLLAQIAASPAKENIILMDFNRDIWTIWAACDIAVVPSTEPESFGLTALEAMASGKPVIAANHGGLTDLVVHNKSGLLVEPGSVHALADAIMFLANNPKLRDSMGIQGMALQEKKFSINRFIQGFTELYDKL